MMSRIARLRRSQEGFTLIELLVVVAIIALLATFAVPKLFDAINKSKKAPGQADVQTIAGALDRFYMDQNPGGYPIPKATSTTPTEKVKDIKDALSTKGYLKTTTTFYNGWQNGYMYVTDSAGSFYVFMDAQKKDYTSTLILQCGTGATTPQQNVTPGNKDLSYILATTITATEVQQGCKLGTMSGSPAAFTPLPDNADGTVSYTIVTN